MQEILIENYDAINEAFEKLTDSEKEGLIAYFNDSFEDDSEEKIGTMLFGNCHDDFEEKVSKLGPEEKTELKKAVEEAGLLETEENN